VMKRLLADVLGHTKQVTWADSRGTVTLGPSKVAGSQRAPLVDPVRGCTLHSLHEPWEHRCWMESQDHVQVRRHESEFKKATPFLPDDDRKMLCQIGRSNRINQGLPGSSGPDHVQMEVVVHVRSSVAAQHPEYQFNARPVALATPAEPSLQRRAEPTYPYAVARSTRTAADGTSRAVASATSSPTVAPAPSAS
jgi:hypothetical protein